MGSKADLRCTRQLADQVSDTSGAVRRGDHPRASVGRLDLLSDEDLDGFRSAFPQRSEEALDAVDALAQAMLVNLAALEDEAGRVLEDRGDGRPILAIIACSACGEYGIARVSRPWPVDRAMRRSGFSERDIRTILVVLAESLGDHDPRTLDGLSDQALHELRDLVGQDVDLVSLRERYGS